MERVIQIYAQNSIDVEDVYRIHKVCQCIADDELFAKTGVEPEVLEIFSFFNKQMVNELKNERGDSYDYLQKNGRKNNSDRDEESQGSQSWQNSQGVFDDASAGRGSAIAENAIGLINASED